MEIIKVSNLSKYFKTPDGDAKFKVLDGISFSLSKNDVCIIAGTNGAGKSVLMSILAGLDEANEGEIEVNARLGLVFQDADSQILGETPREDVAFGLKNMKRQPADIKIAIDNALKEVDLADKADFPAKFLSGGEKKRLSIASILAMKPEIIILDEPFSNLDFPSIRLINKIIINLKAAGKTVIVLTHELEKCLALANRLIILSNQKIVFDGPPAPEILTKLPNWGIHNPIGAYKSLPDLVWL
ncbi:MAG: energy-coupling factor ABC transporter ATP-binding protein [Elusimicrobiota bacterium]|jgi:biotin transport system ATP-binding protein|nr:energy-coupling factor ABC transporter ATP-binding protein [Elusimicrobiota bacterium]